MGSTEPLTITATAATHGHYQGSSTRAPTARKRHQVIENNPKSGKSGGARRASEAIQAVQRQLQPQQRPPAPSGGDWGLTNAFFNGRHTPGFVYDEAVCW
jgi:hypothetical protein